MNPPKEPKLSIIVLAYNRGNYLAECLQSLVNQDIAPELIELIVADDGSTDNTPQIVRKFQPEHPRLVYVRQKHKGIPAARNLGIRHACGGLVAIVADDYILFPDYADTIIRFFHDHPEADIVRFKIIAARDDIFSRLSHFYYKISFLNRLLPAPELSGNRQKLMRYFKKLPVPTAEITTEHELEAAGAAAFRSAVFRTVGLFDEELLRGEDTDYTVRLKALGMSVHYNPFHQVRHQYAWGCLDTLQKSFIHGVNHYHLYRKYAEASSAASQLSRASAAMIHQFLQAFWRARQVKRNWQFFIYFPAMLIFEAAVKAGVCWGFLRR